MGCCPELEAMFACLLVEASVCAIISGQRVPKIVRPMRICSLFGLLSVVSMLRQVAIEISGKNLVRDHSLERGPTDKDFTALAMSCPVNCPRCDLRLENRRYRLRLSR